MKRIITVTITIIKNVTAIVTITINVTAIVTRTITITITILLLLGLQHATPRHADLVSIALFGRVGSGFGLRGGLTPSRCKSSGRGFPWSLGGTIFATSSHRGRRSALVFRHNNNNNDNVRCRGRRRRRQWRRPWPWWRWWGRQSLHWRQTVASTLFQVLISDFSTFGTRPLWLQ